MPGRGRPACLTQHGPFSEMDVRGERAAAALLERPADAIDSTAPPLRRRAKLYSYHRGHLRRIRLSASDREAALDCRSPRTAEVVVTAPGLRIPRIAIHKCSASTTTIAP